MHPPHTHQKQKVCACVLKQAVKVFWFLEPLAPSDAKILVCFYHLPLNLAQD